MFGHPWSKAKEESFQLDFKYLTLSNLGDRKYFKYIGCYIGFCNPFISISDLHFLNYKICSSQCFTKEFKGQNPQRTSSFGQVQTPSPGVYQMQMGHVTLEVSSGDITKETCDVIINSSNQNFTLKSGVSKAILDAAGRGVELECANIVNSPGYQPKAMIITSAGQLPSKNIIHVTGSNNPSIVKDLVYNVLKVCEENKLQSVAFPALGTGQRRRTLREHWTAAQHPLCTLTRTEFNPDVCPVQIERVQNVFLWKNYQIKKKEMDTKNKHQNNEKVLYHGTGPKPIDLINKQGFNRSYAGTHAAMYGNGTYFAVDPAYSVRGYSKPDANGHKRLYVALVLVGEFTTGRQGMIAPPAKGNPSELYDSVTDRAQNPSMFIIFNDVQAYPQYLITFT
uniref:Poly [ADP-ribose] polymerase n=1 Tax=Neogobius melanostomus TaxID=47308 RepID=A0A8C6WMQ6_9GOBI